MFELVPGLAKKIPVTELKLCKVLFENNRFYPWIFLVPKRENAKNMTFLSMEDRLQLMREMALCEKVMTELFPHDQTNVAMIGNKTPQLHVHILCRKEGDPDWPTTVWNNHSEPYPADEAEKTAASIKNAIEQEKSKPEYAQN
jgi:histidine triad protein, putative